MEKLSAAHQAGQLQLFGQHAGLAEAQAFAAYLAPLRSSEWVVYCKRPRRVEDGDVAAAVAIEILDDPVAPALAIGMDAHLAGLIVETQATPNQRAQGGS